VEREVEGERRGVVTAETAERRQLKRAAFLKSVCMELLLRA